MKFLHKIVATPYIMVITNTENGEKKIERVVNFTYEFKEPEMPSSFVNFSISKMDCSKFMNFFRGIEEVFEVETDQQFLEFGLDNPVSKL